MRQLILTCVTITLTLTLFGCSLIMPGERGSGPGAEVPTITPPGETPAASGSDQNPQDAQAEEGGTDRVDSLQATFDASIANMELLLAGTPVDSEGGEEGAPLIGTAPAAELQVDPIDPSSEATPVPAVEESEPDPNAIDIGPLVTPTFFPAVYTDTSQQLATFDAFWQIVAEEYIYPDFNGVDWDGVRARYRPQVEAGMSNPAFWNMLTEIVYLLDDEHSYFVPTDKAEGIRNLIDTGVGYSGVGVSLIGRPEQGDALAAWVIPGNGLHAAGVRSGDRIIAVNGHPICCTPNGEPFEFLLGPEGSVAQITYQAAGRPVETVPVTRGPIEVNEVIKGERRDGGIGYIELNTFLAAGVATEFNAVWTDLNSPERLNGLIIDLRQNTGGLVVGSNRILSLFVDGTIFHYYEPFAEDGTLIPRTFAGEDLLGSQSIPLVVLVGEATNSRGEIFAGIIHDMGRGTIIGRPTNGNIETITPFDLPDGSIIYIATDSLVPLSGDDWEADGITLDIEVDQAYGEIARDGYDEALERALELLSR